MNNPDPPMQEQESRLQQELVQDAQRKAQRALDRARRDADSLMRGVEKRQEQERQQALERARAEGNARARAITAGIRHEIHKEWLLRREAVLAEALAAGLDAAQAVVGAERMRSLAELLAEALAALGAAERLTLYASPEDAPRLRDEVIPSVAARLGLGAAAVAWTVVPDPECQGGFVLASADGRCRCDQRYAARLARLRNDLRAAAADAVGAHDVDMDAIIKESTSDVG
jgi:vacuolar-type H+-ATPase subunit E/Vma4